VKASHLAIALASVGALASAAWVAVRFKRGLPPALLVGDSLAVGLAGPFKSLGLAHRSIAVQGTTVDYWTKGGKTKLQSALAGKPGLVFVSLGTNDAYAGPSYASTAADATTRLLTTIASSGAQVIWIGPPALPPTYGGKPTAQSVIDAIRSVVEATAGAMWLDNSAFAIPRAADQLHPTAAGYSSWANLLVDLLGQFFVSPGPAETGTKAALEGDDDEPSPRPDPPSAITVPEGWARLKNASRPMLVFGLTVLAQRRPLGDVQTKTIDGRSIGALTEWHWDNHVDHVWKWHRGISLLEQKA